MITYKFEFDMNMHYHILIIFILLSVNLSANGNEKKPTTSEKDRYQLTQSLRGNGICFTPNKGQFADMNGKLCPDILYKGEGNGADIYLRKTGISYVQSNVGEVMREIDEQLEEMEHSGLIDKEEFRKTKDELLQEYSIKIHRIDMDFEGTNSNCRFINEELVDGYQNYYYAHCPQGITNVHQYNKVTYKNIYNGIDIAYYGNKQNGIKYDLIVQPHADPSQINLHWKGAESIKLAGGKLIIQTGLSEITEMLPKVYQNINEKIIDIQAHYTLSRVYPGKEGRESCGEVFVTFELGTWNPEYSLIIDPWATYYGGTAADFASSVACDNTGNVYMTGFSSSPNTGNVIATAAGFQTVNGGGVSDSYLVKFNSATGTRIWATYYGGTGEDRGHSVACDNTGNVYIAGMTGSPNGIASATGFQTGYGGGVYDAFLAKFNSVTGARTWGTYYGGGGFDNGRGVACDNTGNVYLTGFTDSPNVMATAAGFQPALGGMRDGFLVKFNSATGARTWATYYGGIGDELSSSVNCDNTGNVYIAGQTNSPNTGNAIATAAGFQPVSGGGMDAFIVKFNSAIGSRTWASYYGGTSADLGYTVACDNTGNVYLAGITYSPSVGNAIATPGAFQTIFGGVADAFLVKFNSTTGIRSWGTYYGSGFSELTMPGGIAFDGNNNMYLYLEVEDASGPLPALDSCAYQPNYAGGKEDQIIVKFNPDGKKLCATYFGGTGYEDLDNGGGIAISGNLMFFCAYGVTNYPVTPGAHQTVPGGGYEAVLACLCINICEGALSIGLDFTAATTVCANAPVTFTPAISNTCDTTGYKFHWVFTGGNPATSDSVKPTVTFAGIGTHDVKLIVTTPCKKDSLIKTNFITVNPCTVCNINGQFVKGTANCANCGCKEWIMVNANGGTSPYSYSWPDGYVNRYKNQLCPGNYTINVKDVNGCSAIINLSIP